MRGGLQHNFCDAETKGKCGMRVTGRSIEGRVELKSWTRLSPIEAVDIKTNEKAEAAT